MLILGISPAKSPTAMGDRQKSSDQPGGTGAPQFQARVFSGCSCALWSGIPSVLPAPLLRPFNSPVAGADKLKKCRIETPFTTNYGIFHRAVRLWWLRLNGSSDRRFQIDQQRPDRSICHFARWVLPEIAKGHCNGKRIQRTLPQSDL